MIKINKITLCDITLNNFLGLRCYETITLHSVFGFLELTLNYKVPCEELKSLKDYSTHKEPLYFEVDYKTYTLIDMGAVEDTNLQISILLEEK